MSRRPPPEAIDWRISDGLHEIEIEERDGSAARIAAACERRARSTENSDIWRAFGNGELVNWRQKACLIGNQAKKADHAPYTSKQSVAEEKAW